MYLIAVDTLELDALKDAIGEFADRAANEDRESEFEISLRIWKRLDTLDAIERVTGREWVRHAGVGPWRAKPQG